MLHTSSDSDTSLRQKSVFLFTFSVIYFPLIIITVIFSITLILKHSFILFIITFLVIFISWFNNQPYLTKNELLTGKSPYTVAGAAVYLATQLDENKKSFKQIGEAAELADATIRNAYKQVFHLRYKILEELATKEEIDKAFSQL